jgi:hypothetical protein
MTTRSSTRRRWLATAAAAASSLGISPALAQRGPRDVIKPHPRMGINLAGLNYWNTELPFVDLMRMSGEWSLWRRDTPGVQVKDVIPSLDARGWLRALPEGLVAMLPLAARSHLSDSKRAPWVVRYDGRGDMEFEGALRVVRTVPGRIECEFVAQNPLPDPSLWLRITRIDAQDPLRNIRVFKPGTESQPATNVWDAGFIARWSGWGALRAMDMLATNNSKLSRWSDRPLPDDRTFAPQGIALELLVDLANRCGAGPWLCMPHRADDDYLRRAASLVSDKLDDRLPLWVEHSNEVWNPDFEQAAYASQQGVAQGLAPEGNTARWRWHAKRSRDIFAIWSQPFGSSKRLKRVLGTQTSNSWGTQQLLREPVIETTDVLAVAAYLPLTPGVATTPTAAEVARWPMERVFEHFEKELAQLETWQAEQRRWCARNGLLLAAYEGGQHAVGIGDAVRDAALERLFTQANRDERMGLMYRRLFDRWEDADGDLFCHFSAVSAPSRWGNWGLLEHHDDDPATRPKYRVTVDRMRRWRSA